MTYARLESESNRLGRMLKAVGCGRGDRVCFMVPKSPMAIVAIMGILKTGAAYVPLDPSYGVSRLARVLESCDPRCVLAAGPVGGALRDALKMAGDKRPAVGWLGATRAPSGMFNPAFSFRDTPGSDSAPIDAVGAPEDPAYILFTSGSTGAPKGVVISHANVAHFIHWANRYFGVGPSDRLSGHTPLYFDLSVYDVFGSIAAGAELHLVPPEVNLLPTKVADFMRDSRLTQWFSVPSVLNYLAKYDVVKPNDFPSLKRLLWCGEVLPTPTLIYWMQRLPHVTFTNLYGPTETTIASSYYTVPFCPKDERASIPIGVPCEGEEFLVLDQELKPVPPDTVGDLYIGGVGPGLGYWRDPEKTDAAFIPDPRSEGRDRRIYKTGDLARVGTDGLAYFIGRTDTQIKSRGYRIELGEVETALNAVPFLLESAVVAVETDGFEGKSICCAFVPREGMEVTPRQLRTELLKSIPSYMLPARWAAYPRLPKNANGKTDRALLKEDFVKRQARKAPISH